MDSAIHTFQEKYSDIMTGAYHKELIQDSEAQLFIKACKDIARDFVYNTQSNLKLELAGRKVIHDLMDFFWEGVSRKQNDKFAPKLFSLMSPNYRRVFDFSKKELKLPETYCQMQLVTDYICGMTDTFACELHRKLTNG